MITILTGKSGSGKDYIQSMLINKYNYIPIISTTTRPIRTNEINGKDYNFITKEEFINKVKNNEFIDYSEYNTLQNGIKDTWYYGVEKINIDDNKNYVIVLDINSVNKFKQLYKCICYYIYCDNKTRKKRYKNRDKDYSITEWKRRERVDKEKWKWKNVRKNCDRVLGNRG